MRVLVTGAAGFVGGYLTRLLLATGAEVHGTSMDVVVESGATTHYLDLKDKGQVRGLLADLRPDRIYHLAAQAFVPRSFEAPWETLENNILAQLNLIVACIELGIQPRMLVVSSAEIYGQVTPDELPLDEDSPLRPTSPYGVSKVTQDMLAYQYALSHKLPIMRVRPFNHFGPGQRDSFVAPAFATQIARIEAQQQEPVIRVGDLSAKRDFTDVRDIVRAYHAIMEKGSPGDLFVVSSGQARSIQSVLDGLLALSDVQIEVLPDPERMRPVNNSVLLGDSRRLQQAIGWTPEITFEQSLADIMNDCRQRVAQQGKA